MRKLLIYCIYLYAFFVPLEYIYVVLFGFDNPLKPYRILSLISISLFTVFMAVKKHDNNIKVDRYDILFFILFLYGFLVAMFRYYFFDQGNFEYAINDIELIIFSYIMYIIIKYMHLKKFEIDKILKFFFLAVLINVFYIIYKAFVLHDFVRLGGFFKNPNQAAEAIVIAILLLIYFLSHTRKKNYLLFFLFFPMVMALLFTGSRGALIGLVVVFFIWYLQNIKKSFSKVFFASSIALLIIFGLESATTSLDLDRLTNRFSIHRVENSGGSGRIDIWKSGLHLGADTMFTGVGTSQYRAYHHKYIRQLDNVYITLLKYNLGLHSDYMSMLVEYSFIGLIIYLYIFSSLLSRLKNIQKNDKHKKLANLFFLIIITMLIQGIFQMSYILPMYWLMIALGMSTLKLKEI